MKCEECMNEAVHFEDCLVVKEELLPNGDNTQCIIGARRVGLCESCYKGTFPNEAFDRMPKPFLVFFVPLIFITAILLIIGFFTAIRTGKLLLLAIAFIIFFGAIGNLGVGDFFIAKKVCQR